MAESGPQQGPAGCQEVVGGIGSAATGKLHQQVLHVSCRRPLIDCQNSRVGCSRCASGGAGAGADQCQLRSARRHGGRGFPMAARTAAGGIRCKLLGNEVR